MLYNPYHSKKIFFSEGNTKSHEFRITQLRKLKSSIEEHEKEIIHALTLDLSKPLFESYTAEIGVVYKELNHAINHLKKWMKPKKEPTPIYLQPSNSYIHPEPKGVVLIISPWNYPFQLTISPLIGAMAAGNCVVLKPSNQSSATQEIISKIIDTTFDDNYISVVEGPGSTTVSPLISKYRFDHIFFTGSVDIGKEILSLSAEHLTPVTLELGGKSPTIVHEDADIDMAAKKITWAKFYNGGQTCIAPDYVLVHESKKDIFVERMKLYINKFYGENKEESKNLGRIISEQACYRLISLLYEGTIIEGGNYNVDNRFIAPTLVDDIDLDHEIMRKEIFGPLLPILVYSHISEVVEIIGDNPYPLALYLFTTDKSIEQYIINNIQFGGGCINDTISHIVNPNLPFGGVGYSGMGKYHSIYTFETFSHYKSIFKSKGKFENNLKYPPYNQRNLKLARWFLK